MPLKIVIADDHAIVRSGLTLLLNSLADYQVVASVINGEQLLHECQRELPDLIITDLSMPGIGGVELIRRLQLKWPNVDLMVFSIYQNPYLTSRLMAMGVKAYISKNSDTDIILAGITAITEGKSYLSPDIDSHTKETQPLSKLTARELDIFCCIAKGLSTKQSSMKLYLSEKTVANNISIIKRKLKIASSIEMVHLAMLEGLISPS
ncbi:response regulator transcription factor [Colwellia sp. M166]|uniref:response regulator n=1 Tax=Colwellia sp. M166 TaxID=2583805 RepID=UPI00211DDA98|nr:response regulator transcription factor [Colwellia sp. M166]UUO25401.1 response regulator transcription factor [Colwellia sp. M166]|tara:strand:- start:3039 stop:3659 length:621 start_codon:yes stop_codon:yes gene_type:complete